MQEIKFEDKNIESCEINKCSDGSVAVFIMIDFFKTAQKLVGGGEIMLTEKELEAMIHAIRNEENWKLFGPVYIVPDNQNIIFASGALNIDRLKNPLTEGNLKTNIKQQNDNGLKPKYPPPSPKIQRPSITEPSINNEDDCDHQLSFHGRKIKIPIDSSIKTINIADNKE